MPFDPLLHDVAVGTAAAILETVAADDPDAGVKILAAVTQALELYLTLRPAPTTTPSEN